MEKEEKKGRGGARKGAGRKKKGDATLYTRIASEALQTLKQLSKSNNMTVGEYITNVLLPLQK